MSLTFIMFFFFQAEDGIRDVAVTGVQTCALPISDAVRRGCARGSRCCAHRVASQSCPWFRGSLPDDRSKLPGPSSGCCARPHSLRYPPAFVANERLRGSRGAPAADAFHRRETTPEEL